MLGGRLGRLAAWHLPAGPVFPASRWAATSNFEADQTTYHANREMTEGRKWSSEGQSHKWEESEGGNGTVQGPSAKEGGLHVEICTGAPEFLVTPLLMRPVCLLSQGRFEEPVRPWLSPANNRNRRKEKRSVGGVGEEIN